MNTMVVVALVVGLILFFFLNLAARELSRKLREIKAQADREEALEQAMDLFWSQGYEATGVTQLCDRMGLGRQSLYNTFGGTIIGFLEDGCGPRGAGRANREKPPSCCAGAGEEPIRARARRGTAPRS